MRAFQDDNGKQWEVYEVSSDTLLIGRPEFLPVDYRNGWLVFDNGVERRRLAPVPADWSVRSIDELRTLLRESRTSRAPRFETPPDGERKLNGPEQI